MRRPTPEPRRRSLGATVGVLIMLVALASGCGGGSGVSRSQSPAPAAGGTVPPAVLVTVRVAGRILHGHCSGNSRGGPAVLLESGMDAGQNELAVLEKHLAARTRVCAYDRAGVGDSGPATTTPRTLDDLVADLDAFAGATHAAVPFVLAGQSLGATVVLRYAQTHPGKVSGVLSMNPVPPVRTYLRRVKPVETADEYAGEEAFYRGENDENVELTSSEKLLTDPMPPTLPYTVMFDEDCDGDTGFCNRILPALTRTTQELAARGPKGTFVRATGAGHRIFSTQPDLVAAAADELLTS